MNPILDRKCLAYQFRLSLRPVNGFYGSNRGCSYVEIDDDTQIAAYSFSKVDILMFAFMSGNCFGFYSFIKYFQLTKQFHKCLLELAGLMSHLVSLPTGYPILHVPPHSASPTDLLVEYSLILPQCKDFKFNLVGYKVVSLLVDMARDAEQFGPRVTWTTK